MTAKRKRGANPFRGVLDMMSEMNRISDTMSNLETSSGYAQPRGHADAWSPTTDIFARGDDLVIQCEIPGVNPDEVEVSFSHGYLTISGERRRNDEDRLYYASERFLGNFRREVTLPVGIDEDSLEANFDDGLLEVTVHGGADASGPSQIEVQSKKRRGK